MCPRFVPVTDTEKPRCEQGAESMAKHRAWDSFVVARDAGESREMQQAMTKATAKPKADRGWERGSVGWGVLGAWGSNERDDSAQIARVADGRNKMIRNEKGLWVKAKDGESSASAVTNTNGAPAVLDRGHGDGPGIEKVTTTHVQDRDGRRRDSSRRRRSSSGSSSDSDDSRNRRRRRDDRGDGRRYRDDDDHRSGRGHHDRYDDRGRGRDRRYDDRRRYDDYGDERDRRRDDHRRRDDRDRRDDRRDDRDREYDRRDRRDDYDDRRRRD